MSKYEVCAILPVYNDRESLETAIPRSIEVLEKITDSFLVVVAEDGSTDGSAEFVREWEEKDSRVLLFHADERLGRGTALTRVIRAVDAEIVCYYDVDLATDMAHLPALIQAIRDGNDIATGSRLMPESDIVRTQGREVASRGYNFLVRTVLNSRLYDHQCGFKAFRRDRILSLLDTIEAPHWFWDTELLVRAQKKGFHIAEFPVRWRTSDKTTVRFSDVTGMGMAIFHLRRHLND
ncbi:glycosyltransferase [Methanogenium organophilum]|uniref:Glycosyltransferase n=1 Tax=Methanogenium organophilum TaxID=2199 RepID=A0A9X9S2H3_METOG|nr:glycosyltransferase [Methanogenium organophilum]WAI00587.1 glycosyltransferase [Methanogenium organophilum]